MSNQRIKFEFDSYFHVYNHGNGSDNIFRCEDNYRYFLQRYFDYILPMADTYVYCLMPNHFHFLLKIKSENEILDFLINQGKPQIRHISEIDFSFEISRIFSNFFNSYAKSFNNMYVRKGSLFLENFKRKKIADMEYLIKLVQYIHNNPVHHGFVERMEEWHHSSYNILLNDKDTFLKRDEVLEWFGGISGFKKFHQWDPGIKPEFE